MMNLLNMDQQVSGQQASSTYLKVVKRSQFISSDKVIINLISEIKGVLMLLINNLLKEWFD